MPHFKTSDGLNLHYTDQGAGLPILCLAGLTRSGRDFEFVAPHLHDVRLITLDYRGRGASDWADDFTTYAVPRETQDAIELLDDLGLEKVAILGTSRGGLNAMYMAATAKDRLLGVALNDVGPKLEQAGLDIISDYLGRRPAAKTHAESAEARARTATGFANVPKRSTLVSRSEVELNREFKFRHSDQKWTGVPIFSANMDTTGTFETAKALQNHNMLTAVHKFYTLNDWEENLPNLNPEYLAVTVGTSDDDFQKSIDI